MHDKACFFSQQAGEKALKALLYFYGKRSLITHSLSRMVEELKLNSGLLQDARMLDKLYIPTRYPDALPESTPAEEYTKVESQDALKRAERIILFVKKKLV